MDSLNGFNWLISDPVSPIDDPICLYTDDINDALEFALRLVKARGRYGDVRIQRFDGQVIQLQLIAKRATLNHTQTADYRDVSFAVDPTIDPESRETIKNPYGEIFDKLRLTETIPREDAIKALHEFLETGQCPTCVTWR